ncbi:MAG: threonine ammonia-lyase IlvA [Pseudomonadota bacterium]|nr:threonine ammonia-lyase IlvA [Pseudomonadota bacterium]
MQGFKEKVASVHAAMAGIVQPTPLQLNAHLSERHGARVFLKREDLSPVRSYKIRGALAFFLDVLAGASPPERFACASAGNHAQGLAYACRHFGRKGVVFMPVTTPQQKIMKTEGFGAPDVEIRLVGDSFDEAYAQAIAFCESEGAMLVPPFDDKRIVTGQAGVAKEIVEQFGEFFPGEAIDLVVLPVGGGGLAAGVTRYFAETSPATEFVFVEPDGAPSLHESLKAGRRVKLDQIDSFVDGAAVAEIGAVNHAALKGFSADQVVLAPTNGVCATMLEMLNHEGIVLEPAGALSVDALKRLSPERIAGRNVVCVTSGGNFDFERLPEVKERALKFEGKKKYFILRMPQRPGALKDFLFMLEPEDDIARFEYLKKSARNFGSVLIGIETTKPENFEKLKARLAASGMRFQDITDNEIIGNLVV